MKKLAIALAAGIAFAAAAVPASAQSVYIGDGYRDWWGGPRAQAYGGWWGGPRAQAYGSWWGGRGGPRAQVYVYRDRPFIRHRRHFRSWWGGY